MQPMLGNRKSGQGHHEERMKCLIRRKPKKELEERKSSRKIKLLKKKIVQRLTDHQDFWVKPKPDFI
jgi:hypothetical protein